MRAHSAIRVGLAALLLVTLGGCTRYEQQFVVRNELDVSILTWYDEDPDDVPGFEIDFETGVEPGGVAQVGLGMEEPGFPWNVWPFSLWAEVPCRDDIHLIAITEDGRRFVHEPPLCIDGDWTISE